MVLPRTFSSWTPVNLTRHPGTDGYPRVSPDGQLIGFNSSRNPATFSRGSMDREHNHEIDTMTLAGGDLRRVTDLPDWDTDPAISADGKQFAFVSNRANSEFEAFDIHVAATAGSHRTRVSFSNGIEATGSWTRPSFAADGQRMLCTRTVGTSVDGFVITLR